MRRFLISSAPQRSDQWFAERLGRLTGSRAADMLTTRKDGKPAATRAHLLAELVLERLTGKPQANGYQSAAMVHGIETEPAAKRAYMVETAELVTTPGFLTHMDHMAGCSVDGEVDNFQGLIEIKCPLAATHLETLETGTVPGDYLKQIYHEMWITGAQWCDWMSYHPDFPPAMRSKIIRVLRDDAVIADYEKKALAFLAEVESKHAALKGWRILDEQSA